MEETKGIAARYTSKAGLQFSIGKVAVILKNRNYRYHVRTLIFIAAVLEYLSTEVLELAGKAAMDRKSNRITAKHIKLALKNDSELSKVFGSDTKQDKDTSKPPSTGKGKGKAKTRPVSYKSLAIQLNNMTL